MTKELRPHTYPLEDLAVVSEQVRYHFSEYGYLHAEVSDPIAMSVNSTTVDVTLHIRAGPQYRLKEVQISGAKAFATLELRGLIPLQAGDVFNVGAIRTAFEARPRARF